MRNLLDASRVEAGTLRLRKEPQDLRELLANALTRVQALTDGRTVHIDVSEDLPPVGCDYQQIEQVVVNLLENAALHTPPSTPITIEATNDARCVRVAIADAGPGIPLAERERLFRPFERGATAARGSGLGLAIARVFVEAHGGRIWVDDTPSGGARVSFTVPLDAA